MATVVDALLITLGLDPSDFDKGRKKAGEDFLKTREDAAKTAKDIEAQGKRAAEFFSKLRNEAIGLFAAFTAGRGIKEFTEDITRADAALYRMAQNTGKSVEELSTWRGVAVSAGGSADGITNTIGSLTREFQQWSATGNSSIIPFLRALHVNLADENTGKAKDLTTFLLDLSAAVQGLDPAKASFLLSGLHIDADTINVLLQGPDALRKYLELQKQLGIENKNAGYWSNELVKAWGNLQTAATGVGRIIATWLEPKIIKLLGYLQDLAVWAQKNPETVENAFIAIASAVGLLTVAIGALAARAAFRAIAAGIAAIGAALGAATVEGLLIFGAIALLAVAGYELIKHWDTVKKWWGDFWNWASETAEKSVAKLTALWGKFKNFLKGDAAGDQPKNPVAPAVPAPGRAGVLQKMAAEDDVNRLVQLGFPRNQAIGIVANLQRESGGNPSAVGDSGQAYGLAQWHPDRQAAFKKQFGHDIRQSTRDEQLQFAAYELTKGSETGAGRALSKTTTAGDAADVVARLWERPKNPDADAATSRSYADQMAGNIGAGAAASFGSKSTDNSKTSTTTNTMTIGKIDVNTQATDADGFARDLKPAMQRDFFANNANFGSN